MNGDDGYISREEIFDLLRNSLHQLSSKEETDEGVKELVDITLKKMVRMKNVILCIQSSGCWIKLTMQRLFPSVINVTCVRAGGFVLCPVCYLEQCLADSGCSVNRYGTAG